MLVAGALFLLAPQLGGIAPSRRRANARLGLAPRRLARVLRNVPLPRLPRGSLVVGRGLTPEQAEEATPLHAPLIVGSGVLMFCAFWFLLATIVAAFRQAPRAAALVRLRRLRARSRVGTLQGPVQALPAVNELLDRGGDAGDVIVNLHAQLNMLGGLMVLLVGARARAARPRAAARARRPSRSGDGRLLRRGRRVLRARGVARVERRARSARRCARSSRGPHSCSSPPRRRSSPASRRYAARRLARDRARAARGPRGAHGGAGRVCGADPCAGPAAQPGEARGIRAADGLLGFPGVGWLFGGFPFRRSILLCGGPALAWAVLPIAFTPYGEGPLRSIGWKIELAYLPRERAPVGGAPLPGAPQAPAALARRRRRGAARRRRTLPHARRGHRRVDPARPRLAAARARGRRASARAASATRSSRG